jgi:phosphinothricin acetyltransferase
VDTTHNTERIESGVNARIRLALEADSAAIAAIYRPIVESTAISFETVAPDATEMSRRLRETMATHPWLVCERGGTVAGYAYATKHRVRGAYRWSVDTSVYVAGAHQRLGLGRRLYLSLFAVLTAQGYVNAFAGIALPNDASVGLHEALGFAPLGVYRRVGYKLGEWRDVGWWQLILGEHRQTPAEPLSLAAVSATAEWPRLMAESSELQSSK